MKIIKRIYNDIRCNARPYYIGFVRGHSYLTKKDILKINVVLNNWSTSEVIKEYESKFSSLIGPGSGVSFAAGRMAFYALMKVLGIGEGDEVILLGFTCSVMPNAVLRIGAKPVFSDIDVNTFGSDGREIEKCITPRTKMIVAQHSFGIPCNITPIRDVARKYNIFLLEDSAITLDSSVEGMKVGNWGDAAMFSTDHTKPLNTLIGGFLYTKNTELYARLKNYSETLPHLSKDHQERLYDRFLFERRHCTPKTYFSNVPIEYIQLIKRKIDLLQRKCTFLEVDGSNSISPGGFYPYPAKMPAFLALIGLFELERWDRERKRRKTLLSEFLKISEHCSIEQYLPNSYFNKDLDIVPLRFVFTHPEPKTILDRMEKMININWSWFRDPIISCENGPESMGYECGSCVKSETAGKTILNFPCVVEEGWEGELLNCFNTCVCE